MSAFSNDMRQTVLELCQELGNSCVLSYPTVGTGYDPLTGETDTGTIEDYHTYSAQYSKVAVVFGTDGANTNLSAFDDERVIVPWIGKEIDTTWLYNGNNITNVSSIESDNDVLYYTLSIGEKR